LSGKRERGGSGNTIGTGTAYLGMKHKHGPVCETEVEKMWREGKTCEKKNRESNGSWASAKKGAATSGKRENGRLRRRRSPPTKSRFFAANGDRPKSRHQYSLKKALSDLARVGRGELPLPTNKI